MAEKKLAGKKVAILPPKTVEGFPSTKQFAAERLATRGVTL